jgi:hypothetical protein
MVAYTKNTSQTKMIYVKVFNSLPGYPVFQMHTKTRVHNEQLNGFTNSKWRQQISDCENATTNLTATRLTSKRQHGRIYKKVRYPLNTGSTDIRYTKYIGDFAGYVGDSYVNQIGTAAAISEVEDDAKRAYFRKLKATYQQMSGMVFLGELRESLHMIRHPAEALRHSINPYLSEVERHKRRFSGNKERMLKAISGSWLEHSFGWQPLIADTKSAVDAYNQVADRQKIQRISAGAIRKKPVSSSFGISNLNTSGYSGVGYFSHDLTGYHSVRYRGCVKAKVDAKKIDGIFDSFGFNSKEFVPTIWELLPWSFLVDYFGNVGDVLEASSTSTTDVAWVNKTSRIGRELALHFEPTEKLNMVYGDDDNVFFDATASHVDYTYSSISRTSNVSVSLPTLRFELPGTGAQFANMAALWAQVNKGIFPQRRVNFNKR